MPEQTQTDSGSWWFLDLIRRDRENNRSQRNQPTPAPAPTKDFSKFFGEEGRADAANGNGKDFSRFLGEEGPAQAPRSNGKDFSKFFGEAGRAEPITAVPQQLPPEPTSRAAPQQLPPEPTSRAAPQEPRQDPGLFKELMYGYRQDRAANALGDILNLLQDRKAAEGSERTEINKTLNEKMKVLQENVAWLKDVQPSQAVEELVQAESVGEVWNVVKKNPRVIWSLLAQSAYPSAESLVASLVGGATGGVAGAGVGAVKGAAAGAVTGSLFGLAPGALAGAGVGVGAGASVGATTGAMVGASAAGGFASGLNEFDMSVMADLQERKVDITDADALFEFMENNEEEMEEIYSKAFKRAFSIGVFDGAAVIASAVKFVPKKLRRRLTGIAADVLSQGLVQGALGGGGEAVAQLITEGKISVGEVAAEAIAELGTAPFEMGVRVVIPEGGEIQFNQELDEGRGGFEPVDPKNKKDIEMAAKANKNYKDRLVEELLKQIEESTNDTLSEIEANEKAGTRPATDIEEEGDALDRAVAGAGVTDLDETIAEEIDGDVIDATDEEVSSIEEAAQQAAQNLRQRLEGEASSIEGVLEESKQAAQAAQNLRQRLEGEASSIEGVLEESKQAAQQAPQNLRQRLEGEASSIEGVLEESKQAAQAAQNLRQRLEGEASSIEGVLEESKQAAQDLRQKDSNRIRERKPVKRNSLPSEIEGLNLAHNHGLYHDQEETAAVLGVPHHRELENIAIKNGDNLDATKEHIESPPQIDSIVNKIAKSLGIKSIQNVADKVKDRKDIKIKTSEGEVDVSVRKTKGSSEFSVGFGKGNTYAGSIDYYLGTDGNLVIMDLGIKSINKHNKASVYAATSFIQSLINKSIELGNKNKSKHANTIQIIYEIDSETSTVDDLSSRLSTAYMSFKYAGYRPVVEVVRNEENDPESFILHIDPNVDYRLQDDDTQLNPHYLSANFGWSVTSNMKELIRKQGAPTEFEEFTENLPTIRESELTANREASFLPRARKLATLFKNRGVVKNILFISSESDLVDAHNRGLLDEDTYTRYKRKNTKGIFDPSTKTAYVLVHELDNWSSVLDNEAVETLLHEIVGHAGVNALFPSEIDRRAFMLRVYKTADKTKIRYNNISRHYDYDLDTEQGQIDATDEYIASLAETLENRSEKERAWFKKVLDWFRRMLAELGAGSWNDRAIISLLRKSRRNAERNTTTKKPKTIKLTGTPKVTKTGKRHSRPKADSKLRGSPSSDLDKMGDLANNVNLTEEKENELREAGIPYHGELEDKGVSQEERIIKAADVDADKDRGYREVLDFKKIIAYLDEPISKVGEIKRVKVGDLTYVLEARTNMLGTKRKFTVRLEGTDHQVPASFSVIKNAHGNYELYADKSGFSPMTDSALYENREFINNLISGLLAEVRDINSKKKSKASVIIPNIVRGTSTRSGGYNLYNIYESLKSAGYKPVIGAQSRGSVLPDIDAKENIVRAYIPTTIQVNPSVRSKLKDNDVKLSEKFDTLEGLGGEQTELSMGIEYRLNRLSELLFGQVFRRHGNLEQTYDLNAHKMPKLKRVLGRLRNKKVVKKINIMSHESDYRKVGTKGEMLFGSNTVAIYSPRSKEVFVNMSMVKIKALNKLMNKRRKPGTEKFTHQDAMENIFNPEYMGSELDGMIEDEAISSVLHEVVAHAGIDSLFNNIADYRKFMLNVYNSINSTEEGKNALMLLNNRYNFPTDTASGQIRLADEYIANRAERMEDLSQTERSLFKRIIDWFKRMAAERELRKWDDDAIYSLLRKSRKNAERDVSYKKGPRRKTNYDFATGYQEISSKLETGKENKSLHKKELKTSFINRPRQGYRASNYPSFEKLAKSFVNRNRIRQVIPFNGIADLRHRKLLSEEYIEEVEKAGIVLGFYNPEDKRVYVNISEIYKEVTEMMEGLGFDDIDTKYEAIDKVMTNTLMHEVVGHLGIDSMFRSVKDYERFMLNVYNSVMKLPSGKKDILRANKNYKFPLRTRAGQILAADEYLARTAEKDLDRLRKGERELFDRIVIWFKRILAQIGLIDWDKQSIRSILRKSKKRLQTKPLINRAIRPTNKRAVAEKSGYRDKYTSNVSSGTTEGVSPSFSKEFYNSEPFKELINYAVNNVNLTEEEEDKFHQRGMPYHGELERVGIGENKIGKRHRIDKKTHEIYDKVLDFDKILDFIEKGEDAEISAYLNKVKIDDEHYALYVRKSYNRKKGTTLYRFTIDKGDYESRDVRSHTGRVFYIEKDSNNNYVIGNVSSGDMVIGSYDDITDMTKSITGILSTVASRNKKTNSNRLVAVKIDYSSSSFDAYKVYDTYSALKDAGYKPVLLALPTDTDADNATYQYIDKSSVLIYVNPSIRDKSKNNAVRLGAMRIDAYFHNEEIDKKLRIAENHVLRVIRGQLFRRHGVSQHDMLKEKDTLPKLHNIISRFKNRRVVKDIFVIKDEYDIMDMGLSDTMSRMPPISTIATYTPNTKEVTINLNGAMLLGIAKYMDDEFGTQGREHNMLDAVNYYNEVGGKEGIRGIERLKRDASSYIDDEAVSAVLHEIVAHAGIDALFHRVEDFEKFMLNVFNSIMSTEKGRIDIDTVNKNYDFDLNSRAGKIRMADEYIANRAERLEDLEHKQRTMFKRFIDWVKRILAELGIRKWDDQAIYSLLRMSRRNAERPVRRKGGLMRRTNYVAQTRSGLGEVNSRGEPLVYSKRKLTMESIKAERIKKKTEKIQDKKPERILDIEKQRKRYAELRREGKLFATIASEVPLAVYTAELKATALTDFTEIVGEEYAPSLHEYVKMYLSKEGRTNSLASAAGVITRKWRNLANKNIKANDALQEIMTVSTLIEQDMTIPFQPRSGDYVQNQLTEQGKKRRETYELMRKAFDALPKEFRDMYVTIRDHYFETREQLFQAITDRIIAATDKNMRISKEGLLQQLRFLFEKGEVKGAYFPLPRWGKYWAAVHENGVNKKPTAFVKLETKAEVNSWMKAVKKDLVEGGRSPEEAEEIVRSGRVIQDPYDMANTINPHFVREVEEHINVENFRGDTKHSEESLAQIEEAVNQARDQIWQLYLNTMPDVSIRRSFIHRKGTAGFSVNAIRAFAYSSTHTANQISLLEHGHHFNKAIAGFYREVQEIENDKNISDNFKIKAAVVYEELMLRHKALNNPNTHPLSVQLTAFGFFMYLGLSLAAAIVNMSQYPMVTYPYLASKRGHLKAARIMLKSLFDVRRAYTALWKERKRIRYQKDEGHFVLDVTFKMLAEKLRANGETMLADNIEKQLDKGLLSNTQAQDLANTASARADSAVGKFRFFSKMQHIAAAAFHWAEATVRLATYISEHRLQESLGVKDPEVADLGAVNATNKTNFNYSLENKPVWMQGPILRVVTLFKFYALCMVMMSYRALLRLGDRDTRREAARFLGTIIGMQFLLAGVNGMFAPFRYMVMFFLNTLFGDDDELTDWETGIMAGVSDVLGNQAAQWVMYGPIDALTFASVTDRIGHYGLIVRETNPMGDAYSNYRDLLLDAAGPVIGVGANVARAADEAASGNILAAIERAAPKFFGDVVAGVSIMSGLYGTRHDLQRSLFDESVDGVEDLITAGITRMTGFQPSAIQKARRRNTAFRKYTGSISQKRSALYGGLTKAIDDGNMERASRIIREIAEFDQQLTRRGVNLDIIGGARSAVRTRFLQFYQQQGGIYASRRQRVIYDMMDRAFDPN